MVARVLSGLAGLGIWAWGLTIFLDGDEFAGGAVLLAGGGLVVLALRGGWDHWADALTSWLYWR